jgi:hypothetical protein
MNARSIVFLSAVLAAAGCASQPATVRGWAGGRFAPVTVNGHGDSLAGMPADVDAKSGLLVTSPGDDTPLARAGLVTGDLILSVDGEPVDDATDLHDRIALREPGSHASVRSWRDGRVLDTDVTVGRETVERVGSITLGLSLSPALDLWPFDDGIDVLSLLRFRTSDFRADLAGPEAAYLRKVSPGGAPAFPPQEGFEFFLVPVGFAVHRRVVSQESLP